MFPGVVSPSLLRSYSPRGLPAEGARFSALLPQIQNSIPYLFDGDFGGLRIDESRKYLVEILEASGAPDRELLHADFFRLSLCAQWATHASFAQIDVEPLNRFRLWDAELPGETLREMAETVLEAYRWDATALSRRWIASPHSKLVLSSHSGEWFSVATAAYASTRECDPLLAMRVRELIEFEVTRHAKIYLEFRKIRDGAGMLLAAGLVAQNLAELDRAIEGWKLGVGDPLRDFAYRCSQAEGIRAARFGGALSDAGRMHRELLASEYQRAAFPHLPRALRASPELLMPLLPFLDAWGGVVGTHSSLRREDVAATVDALFFAWEKMRGPEGKTITTACPRAVVGILSAYPGGLDALAPLLSPVVERNLRAGLFRGLMGVPEERFLEEWGTKALVFIAKTRS